MDIRSLEIFVAVAAEKSFSAGAERLYITQSAVSKHVQRLENELGMPLFDRSRRQIVLTPAGERILPMARELLRQYRSMLDSLRNDRSLHIAMLPVAESYGFAQLLTEFSSQKNAPALQMEEQQNRSILRMLEENELDGAFCRRFERPQDERGSIVFLTEELVLLVPDIGQPDERADLADYHDHAFLFLEKSTGLWDASLALCLQAGFYPDIRYTGSAGGNISCLVRENAGVALLAEGAAAGCIQDGVRMLHLKQSSKSYLTFTCSAKGRNAPGMAELMSFLRKRAAGNCPPQSLV